MKQKYIYSYLAFLICSVGCIISYSTSYFKSRPLFFSGIPANTIAQVCPLLGHYRFKYSRHSPYPHTSHRCSRPSSMISNCPSGSEMKLQFVDCSFGDHESEFQCLGDWEGKSGERYLGLMDRNQDADVKYRCAV